MPRLERAKPEPLEEALKRAFSAMWRENDRARTLARIAVHERQFEAWWKFELATYLWDLAPMEDIWPFVECFGRADVSLGRLKGRRLDLDATPCIPIELKTLGTFWAGGPNKALGGLDVDMEDLAGDARRANPFGIVALIVTHVSADGGRPDAVFQRYLEGARRRGKAHKLSVLVDEAIPLRPTGFKDVVAAHQLVWIKHRT